MWLPTVRRSVSDPRVECGCPQDLINLIGAVESLLSPGAAFVRPRGQSVTEKRFAVVVGVDDSGIGAPLPALRYAARDAEAIRDLLCDPQIGTYDPADVEIFTGSLTSAAAIKTALRRIALNSDPTDSLLVYFAGHTLTPLWSLGTDVYLVTPDLDESALSDHPDAGLRMSYLQRDVFELFPGATTLILDCCRAGSLLSAPDRPVDLISMAGRDEIRYCALATCARDGAA